jgi:transposase
VNVLKPHLQTTIWTLLRANASQREIERVTGISRHTIRTYQQRFAAERANCPGVATGSEAVASQTAPPRPPAFAVAPRSAATSLCEPHREFIEAQLRLKRNATAIYQDLVDQHGFAGQYNSVKRFCAKLRHKEPEQFDRLSFLPGEEMQVDYGEGAPTRVPGSERYRKPRLFVATLRHSRASFRYVVWKSSHQVWAELHRIYAQRIEIRDLASGALLRTHAKAQRPGTVVLPMAERVFNPSRETRLILRQAGEIGEHASRLCELLFAIEGRVGQRKLWGIVGLMRRYPAHCINAACAQALEQGVYSYKRVLALTEALFAQAMVAIETASSEAPAAGAHALTQQHELIRDAEEYGDLFAHAAATAATINTAPGVQP